MVYNTLEGAIMSDAAVVRKPVGIVKKLYRNSPPELQERLEELGVIEDKYPGRKVSKKMLERSVILKDPESAILKEAGIGSAIWGGTKAAGKWLSRKGIGAGKWAGKTGKPRIMNHLIFSFVLRNPSHVPARSAN